MSDSTFVKSTAVVKYSASQSPATFAQLQCNTDLNLPPSNWLSSSANPHGLQHVLSQSTGFSSFRMAHMFPDCVGEVDVVSDAENIKNLLKLPYSHGQVSMMVHRVENTLLIDDFDIYKHLFRTAEKEWEWLRKFFCEHIRQSFSAKDRNLYLQEKKSRNVLQQRSLVSKFLYRSLAEGVLGDVECENEIGSRSTSETENEESRSSSKDWLPEPSMEQELPDPKWNHKFNRNVVWTFEDIQMLVGTDMPIFGGSTHPCISLRLRDASRPISVLTGIDYWLDNLMSNVPEVVMCYHLNGIVQKYELVKTEELPQMENSRFSPCVIRDVAQNILSFLKSNATKAGHTYWLFKGKDNDVVKLYDLTSLCQEEVSDNPFTVPVAMLLYRVARNMKNNGCKQPGAIRALLDNCVDLLSEDKYPQIVASARYMLAELFVPEHTDPAAPGLESMDTDDDEVEPEVEEEEDREPPELHLNGSVPLRSPCYKRPPPLAGSTEERCERALRHVAAALMCLKDIPDTEAIPMPAPGKKRRRRKGNLPAGGAVLPSDGDWNAHLKRLLHDKACLVLAILAEQDYAAERFGSSLGCIRLLEQLERAVRSGSVRAGCLLGRAGDACFMIAKHRGRLEEHRRQLAEPRPECAALVEAAAPLPSADPDLPGRIESEEKMLLASLDCYERALRACPAAEADALRRRLGNAQNELGVLCMNKAASAGAAGISPSRLEELCDRALRHLRAGIRAFETVKDRPNLALLHSNVGRLMRVRAHHRNPPDPRNERRCYTRAFESYRRALQVLGTRDDHPQVWDTVFWELSTALYSRACALQDAGAESPEAENEAKEALQQAAYCCDVVTPGPRQPVYQYRVASVHLRLASLLHAVARRRQPPDIQAVTDAQGHYEQAAELFALLEQHVDLVKTRLESVALDEMLIRNGVADKTLILRQALARLIDAAPAFEWMWATKDLAAEADINQQRVFTDSLAHQLQFCLRMLAKLCPDRPDYKTFYSITLQHPNNPDDPDRCEKLLEALLKVMNSIKNSNQDLYSF